jgi:hypothetical protein
VGGLSSHVRVKGYRRPSLGERNQCDAAAVLSTFQTGLEQIRCDGLDEPAEQGVVQPTNQIGVADGEVVERTVPHDHGAINATRLIGLLREYADREVESRIPPGGVVIS